MNSATKLGGGALTIVVAICMSKNYAFVSTANNRIERQVACRIQ